MPNKLLQYAACIILMLIGVGCMSSATKNKTSSWVGHYEYEETPVQANAGYAMAMEWKVNIYMKNDSCKATLEVNGQQTFFNLQADVTGDSTVIALRYQQLLDGNSAKFQQGDTLFTLHQSAGGIQTTWHQLTPYLNEPPPKKCTCFIKTAH